MNRRDYAWYEHTVAEALEGLSFISSGFSPGCEECLDSVDSVAGEEFIEPWFSKRPCEVCGSTLGGDRYPVHGIIAGPDEIVHLDACDDCVYYVEYGRLDDKTMAEIGETDE